MSLENATNLLSELKAKFGAGDVVGGKEILSKLKIEMLDFPHGSSDAMQISIESLEIGILMMVEDGDLDSFARNVAQIKPLYAMIKGSYSTTIQESPRKCHILGLNLMNLLVDNRLSEFHAELELLTEDESRNSFVTFPINLERQLMVGIYDEVLNVTVPDPSYRFFVDNLLQTVRDSIADCVEVSYKNMKISDAMTMMKFSTQQELLEYVEESRDDWIVEESTNTLCFQPPPTGSKAGDIPSMKMINQTLSYATEMERIV
jgi:26S proteasome regulatory subunit N12